MTEALLSVSGLSVNYGHIEAVRNLDLSLQAGQVTTLVGANRGSSISWPTRAASVSAVAEDGPAVGRRVRLSAA